jgi:phosphopantetheinyl transferase (holo-ACP synthase)
MIEVNLHFTTELITTQSCIKDVAAPDGDFSPEEQEYFARRSDSQGSRAARSLAKNSLRKWLLEQYGSAPAASDLLIVSAGAPPRLICDHLPHKLTINISLAHSATHAACALLLERIA